MQCATSDRNTLRKRTGGFSSLMRGTHSMRITGQPYFGLSFISGLVARSSPSTATAAGPPWWQGTQGTGQVTSCTARRALPRGTPQNY